MAIRPSLQEIVAQLASVRQQQERLIGARDEISRQLVEFSSLEMELKALLEAERAKFKKRGWSN